MGMIKLTGAVFSTGMLVASMSLCYTHVRNRNIAAISFVAGAALASLINYTAFKRFKYKQIVYINGGFILCASLIPLGFRGVPIDNLYARSALFCGQTGFFAVTTFVHWKIVFPNNSSP